MNYILECCSVFRDRSRSPMRKREPRRDWDREHRGSGMRSGMSPGVNNRGGATQHRPRIYIANIPYDMRWQEVKDLFKEKGNIIYQY